jgi:hypothetical protein
MTAAVKCKNYIIPLNYAGLGQQAETHFPLNSTTYVFHPAGAKVD